MKRAAPEMAVRLTPQHAASHGHLIGSNFVVLLHDGHALFDGQGDYHTF